MENPNDFTREEVKNYNNSWFDRIVNSSLLKLVVIFFLTLLLLIPMALIDNLVLERKSRENHVSTEIATKWGTQQVISSPILAVPYDAINYQIVKNAKGGNSRIQTVEEDWVFLLPNRNTITASVIPEELKRGIYNTVVYNANIEIKGDFSGYDIKQLPVSRDLIKWDKAKLIFGFEDLKGLSDYPKLNFAGKQYDLVVNNKVFKLFPNNMQADLPLTGIDMTRSNFSINMKLRGAKSLNFLPLANQTTITAKGKWANPSFNGGYLPSDRKLSTDSFEATWIIPSFGRKAQQQWTGGNDLIYSFTDMSLIDESYSTEISIETQQSGHKNLAVDTDMVQINFLPEINNYQKINRVAKYGLLIIILTFMSLFFTEIIKKQYVHFIQYILIGVAMVMFYLLLLAISEHFGFNIAYFMAALATTLLISSFIRMITKDNKTSILITGILVLFYSFIFVLMQLRDYSLIVGTLGIFVILAVLMHVSTKINWYQFDKK